jgi:protein phosphatase
MKFDIFEISKIGPRAENQDAIGHKLLNSMLVACIADGVGGGKCGALASQIGVQTFLEADEDLLRSDLAILLRDAHKRILDVASNDKDSHGMATTFSCCKLDTYILNGVHVGDSRIYLLRRNGIQQITIDQTEVARFVRTGKMSPEEALVYPRKNVLDTALGNEKHFEIHEFSLSLESGDRLLLTTDGIHGNIYKREIRDYSLNSSSAKELGEKILLHVEANKPRDNYSLISIFIE